MKNPRALAALLASLTAAGVTLSAVVTVPSRSVADTPKADTTQVKALYTEKCQACHELTGKYDPKENGYTAPEWRRTVDRMMHKADSNISASDATQITAYLITLAPRTDTGTGKSGKRSTDPWATDSLDVWTDAPQATRVFNFASGSLAGLAPVGSGTAGPAPMWSVTADKPGPDGMTVRAAGPNFRADRFALLMDRDDQGRNVDVRVRFRIDAGKASPAVGLVCAYTDPSHYTVLRCNQALGDLALIQIAGSVHTTVQETVIAPAPPAPNPGGAGNASLGGPVSAAPVTPVAATALAPGWHTLRLLVRDGQVRGWIDMQKRISTTLPSYTGGKVGLWTQGNTTASFDNWTVDWYDAPKTAPLS